MAAWVQTVIKFPSCPTTIRQKKKLKQKRVKRGGNRTSGRRRHTARENTLVALKEINSLKGRRGRVVCDLIIAARLSRTQTSADSHTQTQTLHRQTTTWGYRRVPFLLLLVQKYTLTHFSTKPCLTKEAEPLKIWRLELDDSKRNYLIEEWASKIHSVIQRQPLVKVSLW